MLGRWFVDFWKGTVVVTMRGDRVPELLNAATGQGIPIWEISRLKNGDYRMLINRHDIHRLRPLMRRSQIKLRLGRKIGVPFLLWRAWRRKFFLAGALTFLVSLYMLSSVIWSVEVEGAEKRLSPESVEQAAAEIGIKRWAWIGHLPDTDELQSKLQDKLPQITFAGVQIQGTKVKIQVVEKVEGVTPQPTAPQHIVATKKGTVRDYAVHRGKITVARGELVQPGQVLISGSLAEGKSSVHATGEVWAAVYYPSKVVMPLTTTRKELTGETVEKQFLTFWGKPIQIWGYGKIPYAEFEEEAEDKVLKIRDFVFPIQYRHTVYREVEIEKMTWTEQQATEQAKELAKADALSKAGPDAKVEEQILLRSQTKDGKLEVEIVNRVLENISKPVPFTPGPPADPDPNATKPAP